MLREERRPSDNKNPASWRTGGANRDFSKIVEPNLLFLLEYLLLWPGPRLQNARKRLHR